LIEEVTAHAQNDRLKDAREICADGTYLPNNLRIYSSNEALVSCLKNIKFYIKTVPTCFIVTVTPSSGSALICFY
jgi:hypothetical protein